MVIFPDIEKTLVSYFKSALANIGESDVRVGTSKMPPDLEQPDKELVIRVSYGQEDNFIVKTATVTLEVFARQYDDANRLGLLIESLVRGAVGEEIKRVEVRIGPVRLAEQGDYEKRYLDVDMIVKGSTL